MELNSKLESEESHFIEKLKTTSKIHEERNSIHLVISELNELDLKKKELTNQYKCKLRKVNANGDFEEDSKQEENGIVSLNLNGKIRNKVIDKITKGRESD